MKIIIYKITILTTGKSYIGETNNLVRRISQHKHSAKNKCCNRKGMYLDWIAGGINNFSVEILDEFEFKSKADTWDREGEYISKYNTVSNGYNTAYRSSSVVPNPSKNRKWKFPHPMKGKKLPPERCKQISESHWKAPGVLNPAANRYYIIDELDNEYICECREDIAKQLNISFKQAKCIIAHICEWYTTRIHKDDKYIVGRSFKLLKLEKIN
jgi:predicted GIY-YIG superfamily endonuclease